MYFGIIITSNLRRANVKIIKVIYNRSRKQVLNTSFLCIIYCDEEASRFLLIFSYPFPSQIELHL